MLSNDSDESILTPSENEGIVFLDGMEIVTTPDGTGTTTRKRKSDMSSVGTSFEKSGTLQALLMGLQQKDSPVRELLLKEQAKKLRYENNELSQKAMFSKELGVVQAATAMFKEAKALEDCGAPASIVQEVRDRATAIMAKNRSTNPAI
jgi:hypothetical protein